MPFVPSDQEFGVRRLRAFQKAVVRLIGRDLEPMLRADPNRPLFESSEEVFADQLCQIQLWLSENSDILIYDHLRYEELVVGRECQPKDFALIAAGREKCRNNYVRIKYQFAHLLRTRVDFFATFARSSAIIASISRMVSLSVPFFCEVAQALLSQSGAGATVST